MAHTKPANCTCRYPELIARNMCGHGNDPQGNPCPVLVAFREDLERRRKLNQPTEAPKFDEPLPEPAQVFRTKCHPEANGREPQSGERAYIFHFPLEDGSNIAIRCGEDGASRFREMLQQMDADDAAERLLG